MTRRLLAALLAAVLVAASCSSTDDGGATPGPGSDGATTTTVATIADPTARGPYAVGYTELTVVDDARDGRELLVSLWFPVDAATAGEPARYDVIGPLGIDPTAVLGGDGTDGGLVPPADGPFPLIVFSHGSNGIRIQSTFLTETLASHGFVVLAPDHTGNTLLGPSPDEAALAEQSLLRPQDVSFLLDVVAGEYTHEDARRPHHDVFDVIDLDRIGVTGHSYGGYTSLAVATGVPGYDADPRVDALAALAPASSVIGDDARFETLDLPVLLMGGTLDTTTPIDHELTRPWDLLDGDHRYRVDVIDAAHNSFTIICQAAEYLDDPEVPPELLALVAGLLAEGCADGVIPDAVSHELTNRYVVSFFLTHLAGADSYERFLAPTDGVTFFGPSD